MPAPELFDGTHGLISYGKTKTGPSSQKRQAMDAWRIAVGIHEFVIPFDDWLATQKRLGVNKMCRSAKYEVGILKGVLRCGCGSRMDIRTYCKNGKTFSYYYCAAMARQGKTACNTEYIKVECVEDAFLRQLRKIRFSPEYIRKRKAATDQYDIEALQSEITQAQKSIDNLTSALTIAMESPAAAHIIVQIEKLDARKRELENELRQARKLYFENQGLEETEKMIYENICYLLDNFDQISYVGKNELIKKIIKKCVFENGNLHIVF